MPITHLNQSLGWNIKHIMLLTAHNVIQFNPLTSILLHDNIYTSHFVFFTYLYFDFTSIVTALAWIA